MICWVSLINILFICDMVVSEGIVIQCCQMAAMAERRGGFLKNRHRIAVAWRVANGGAMAVMTVMAAWRKIADF